MRILHNTIVTRDDPIVVRTREGEISSFQQIIAGNAVFSARLVQGGVQQHNAMFSFDEANQVLNASGKARVFDPYPKDERLRCPALDPMLLEGSPDAACDFNGRVRTNEYCGAYTGQGRNSGWLPRLALKPNIASVAR